MRKASSQLEKTNLNLELLKTATPCRELLDESTPQYWPLQSALQRPLLDLEREKTSRLVSSMQVHVITVPVFQIAENCDKII